MRTRSLALLLAAFSTTCCRPSRELPPDIHATSPRACRRSIAPRSTKRARGSGTTVGGARGMPPTGPAPLSMYSPGAAKPIHELNQYLRKTVVGPRFFELSALIAAREFDQQYEWSGHEPAGRRAGLEQT